MYVGNFKIYLIYRGYDDLEINNLILHKTLLVSRDIDGALHDCEEQKKITLVFVTVNTISKRKLMKYWLLLMKDKGRKLTCFSESPIV